MKKQNIRKENLSNFVFRENLRLISILVLVIAAKKYGECVSELTVFWCTIIILIGNVRRITNNIPICYFFRMTGYFFPYLLPLLFRAYTLQNCTSLVRVILGCCFSISIFFIWLLIYRSNLRIMLSDQLAAASTREPKWVILFRIYNVLGAAVCEEIFFRGYILGLAVPILLKVGISALFFPLAHVVLPWGEMFQKKDIINQFVIGSFSVAVYFIGLDIIPCILLHLLINMITVIRYLKVYDRHYLRKNRYEAQDEPLFGDLEI